MFSGLIGAPGPSYNDETQIRIIESPLHQKVRVVFDKTIKNNSYSDVEVFHNESRFSPDALLDKEKYARLINGLEALGGRKEVFAREDGSQETVFSFTENPRDFDKDPLEFTTSARLTTFMNYLFPEESVFSLICTLIKAEQETTGKENSFTHFFFSRLKGALSDEIVSHISEELLDPEKAGDDHWELFKEIQSKGDKDTLFEAFAYATVLSIGGSSATSIGYLMQSDIIKKTGVLQDLPLVSRLIYDYATEHKDELLDMHVKRLEAQLDKAKSKGQFADASRLEYELKEIRKTKEDLESGLLDQEISESMPNALKMMYQHFSSIKELCETTDQSEELNSLRSQISSKEAFRRLAKSEVHALVKAMLAEEGELSIRNLQASAQAINKGYFNNPLLERNWAEKGMLCLNEGKITLENFSRLCLFKYAEKLSDFSIQRIKDERGNIKEKDFQIVEEALANVFSKKTLQTLKSLPPEKSIFFSFQAHPESYIDRIETEKGSSIGVARDFYAYQFVLRTAHRMLPNGKAQFVIMPPEIMEMLLTEEFGENAVKPNLVFGFSSAEDFEKTTSRDVFVPFPFAPEPTIIDGLAADGISTYMHDINYHLILESRNPFRELMTTLAKRFPKDSALYNALVDREFQIKSIVPKEIIESYFYAVFNRPSLVEMAEAEKKAVFQDFLQEFEKTKGSNPEFYNKYRDDIAQVNIENSLKLRNPSDDIEE